MFVIASCWCLLTSNIRHLDQSNRIQPFNSDSLRPLPSGRMSVPHAVTFASTVGVAGTTLLTCEVGSSFWAGFDECNDSPSCLIFLAAAPFYGACIFMSQRLRRWRMFSLFDPSGRRTALVALRNCLYLLPLEGITSWWFCLESTLLALAFSCTAASFYLNRTTKSARTMFHASLLYLPVFMSGLLFHRVADNDQCLTIEDSHMFKELSSSKENTMLQRKSDRCLTVEDSRMFNEMSSSNENPMLQKKATRKSTGNQVRPPVAYASIPPFPFLSAPSYP
ncbi:hypothetical protein Leryth_023429 [Lithospermum erythrorhizon]|nr:hypothetical protein Leryth_023429 [Lithospermum erythrorhizon]